MFCGPSSVSHRVCNNQYYLNTFENVNVKSYSLFYRYAICIYVSAISLRKHSYKISTRVNVRGNGRMGGNDREMLFLKNKTHQTFLCYDEFHMYQEYFK